MEEGWGRKKGTEGGSRSMHECGISEGKEGRGVKFFICKSVDLKMGKREVNGEAGQINE